MSLGRGRNFPSTTWGGPETGTTLASCWAWARPCLAALAHDGGADVRRAGALEPDLVLRHRGRGGRSGEGHPHDEVALGAVAGNDRAGVPGQLHTELQLQMLRGQLTHHLGGGAGGRPDR